jgi:hypothetical protein
VLAAIGGACRRLAQRRGLLAAAGDVHLGREGRTVNISGAPHFRLQLALGDGGWGG